VPINLPESPSARNVKAASGKMNDKANLIQLLRAFGNPDAASAQISLTPYITNDFHHNG
jgi:hypothetical protein